MSHTRRRRGGANRAVTLGQAKPSFPGSGAAGERFLAGVAVGVGEGLVEVGEETGDSPSGGGVAFDLAAPAVVGGLGRESQLGGVSLAEPGCVGRGGDEFGAGQEEVALAGAFAGKAEAVPELEFGLEEARLEPLDGGGWQLAVADG